MIHRAVADFEEQQVARFQVGAFDRGGVEEGQGARGAWQVEVVQGFEGVLHQAAAVEAVFQAGATPTVGRTQGVDGTVKHFAGGCDGDWAANCRCGVDTKSGGGFGTDAK